MRPRVFSAILAGLASGLVVLGGAGRLVMRLLALVAGRDPQFGVEGTIGIIVIGGALGTLGGALFALAAPRLPRVRALAGALFGGFLFLVLVPLMPPSVREEVQSLRGHFALATALFWGLFTLYGALLALLAGGAAVPAPDPRVRTSS